MSKTKTKAQLQQEVIDLQLKINNLESQLLNKLAVPIQGTNTTTGAPAPTLNKNTNGIQSIINPEREPLHKPDQPDLDTIAPSYNQLAEIARLHATFTYRPTFKVASMESASLYIQDMHKHINSIPAKDKPWRQFTDEQGNKVYGKAETQQARLILQNDLLTKYCQHWQILKPE